MNGQEPGMISTFLLLIFSPLSWIITITSFSLLILVILCKILHNRIFILIIDFPFVLECLQQSVLGYHVNLQLTCARG